MGGPATPAIGWAGGIERLALLIESAPAQPRPVAILPTGEATLAAAIAAAQSLRNAGFAAEIETRSSLKKRMERVVKSGAAHMVLVGEDELARGAVTVRDLGKREQTEIALDALADHFLKAQ